MKSDKSGGTEFAASVLLLARAAWEGGAIFLAPSREGGKEEEEAGVGGVGVGGVGGGGVPKGFPKVWETEKDDGSWGEVVRNTSNWRRSQKYVSFQIGLNLIFCGRKLSV